MITCIGITSIRNRDKGRGTRALTLPSPGVPGEGEEGSRRVANLDADFDGRVGEWGGARGSCDAPGD